MRLGAGVAESTQGAVLCGREIESDMLSVISTTEIKLGNFGFSFASSSGSSKCDRGEECLAQGESPLWSPLCL